MHHAAGTGRGWGLAPRNCAPRPLQPRAGPRSPQSPRADPARLRSTLGATGRARLGSSRPGFLGSAGEASAASGPPRHPTMVRGPTRSADPAGSRVGGGLPTRPLTPEGRSRLGRARPGGRSPEPGGRLAFPAGGTRALHGARPDRADGLVSPWQRGWPCGCSPPAFRVRRGLGRGAGAQGAREVPLFTASRVALRGVFALLGKTRDFSSPAGHSGALWGPRARGLPCVARRAARPELGLVPARLFPAARPEGRLASCRLLRAAVLHPFGERDEWGPAGDETGAGRCVCPGPQPE